MNARHMAKAFKEADKNGDGLLDLDEYIDFFKTQGVSLTKEEGQELLRGQDKDHDDLISYEEFIGKTTDTERAWNALDTNKNGFLTKQEITMGVKKYKKSLPSVISRNTGDPNSFFDM